MKSNFKIFSISIIVLLVFSTTTFSKEIEKDDVSKQKSKVEKKQQSAKKTESKSEIDKPLSESNTQVSPKVTSSDLPIINQPTNSSSMTGEQINWQVISSGGNTGSSSNYILSGTLGQTAVGLATSTNYQLNSGFWQSFTSGSSGCCVGVRGNVDFDVADIIDISDLVYLVDFMFTLGPDPLCLEEANVDSDIAELIDISDLVYLVDFMFTGGPSPLSCP